jgi:hypothetical protein
MKRMKKRAATEAVGCILIATWVPKWKSCTKVSECELVEEDAVYSRRLSQEGM